MSRSIPAGWATKTFEEFATLQRGFDLPAQNRNSGTFPVIASNGIVGYHDEYKIESPCVVTGRSGSIGKVIYCNENIWPLNTTLYIKDFHKNHPRYIYYFLIAFNLEKYGTGTGVPTLNRNDVHSEIIQVPPLPEQRKIAEILSSADRNIEATEKLIAKLADLKKALMQQLLTQGIGHTEFKPSPLGKIPKDWKVIAMGEIADINPRTPTSHLNYEDEVSFIPMDSASADGYIASLQKRSYQAVCKGFTKFMERDVLFAKITPCMENGKGGLAIGLINGIGFGSTEFHVIREKEGTTLAEFLLYWMNSKTFRKHAEANMTGSAGQKRVPTDFIEQYPIPLPPLREQRKIADILSGVDRKLSAAKVKLAKAKDLKHGLMNDLLTGKTRVNA